MHCVEWGESSNSFTLWKPLEVFVTFVYIGKHVWLICVGQPARKAKVRSHISVSCFLFCGGSHSLVACVWSVAINVVQFQMQTFIDCHMKLYVKWQLDLCLVALNETLATKHWSPSSLVLCCHLQLFLKPVVCSSFSHCLLQVFFSRPVLYGPVVPTVILVLQSDHHFFSECAQASSIVFLLAGTVLAPDQFSSNSWLMILSDQCTIHL